MDPWDVQQVEPQTLIMEKIIMEKHKYGKKKIWKNRSICPSPLILQEKSIMEIMATSKNYGKKKVRITSGDILNPYGEKPNYGKIGRRRRLSKLNVFFFP